MKNIINQIKSNWKSGLVVAIVSIPLSISLAIASGATPLQGLISAIWAMGLAALFASSQYNVFGPAGALSGILLAFTLTHGATYLPIIAIISGLLLLVAYFSKSIRYITLIPAAGLQGFLFAVGLTILVSQIPGGLGISIPTHEKIYLNIIEIFNNLSSINRISFGVCLSGLGFLFFAKKKRPKVPGAIILSLLGIGIGFGVHQGWFPNIALLSNKYPNLSFGLRDFSYIQNTKALLSNTNAITDIVKISAVIAIVTILETIISGKIGEKMTKVGFNKDKEIFGNAIANIGSGLMGGIPATAVLVRTALNIKSGATSKYSQGLAALTALVISALLFNNVFTLLPMSIIAAILIFIAIGIMDFSILKKFYTFEKTSFYLIIITIVCSIVFDTITGILVGTSLTLLIFIARTTYTEPRVTIFRNKQFFTKTDLTKYITQQQSGDIIIMKLAGELNYLNIDYQFTEMKKIVSGSVMIFSLDQLSDIDIDGLEYFEDIVHHLEGKKVTMYITGWNKGIKEMCFRVPSLKKLNDNGLIYDSKSELLQHLGI
ncbi:hypothetical protein P148_SR1C00001G0784 [candidate division SR1 bacterium RAAC1_SR1_1]|nr:hypothetical protein P148_SR1C00001G0784 [candidate division SR1 bacterium RAAC1_SR1_1]